MDLKMRWRHGYYGQVLSRAIATSELIYVKKKGK